MIFAEGRKAEEKKAEKPAAKPAENAPPRTAVRARAADPSSRRNAQPGAAQQPTTRVPEQKIVDTRKSTNVNLDKYDEKLQDMAEPAAAPAADAATT